MAINNMNDGVGKKIVEALKMQSADYTEGEVFVNENPEVIAMTDNLQDEISAESVEDVVETEVESTPIEVQEQEPTPQSELQMKIQSQLQFQAATQAQPQSFIDNAFNQSLAQNLGSSLYSVVDDFDYPANVAVLKQLIAKLPTGVSKQTGALIIKQTMEALGISMGGVLQEAKQVHDTLLQNSKECQNSVVEYRKQISILEAKAQQYQKQASVMNDIINLFIQTH